MKQLIFAKADYLSFFLMFIMIAGLIGTRFIAIPLLFPV
jgi:hypothetical protein